MNIKRKTYALLVCLMAVVAISCNKSELVPSQSGTPSEPTVVGDGNFSGGYGTKDAPYLIATADDLAYLSAYSNSALASRYASCYFEQTADIDMSNMPGFLPMFLSLENGFTGQYDGKGHSVKGLVIHSPAKAPCGFFSSLNEAIVQNLSLEAVDVDAVYVYAGSVAGKLVNSKLGNCRVSGQIRQYEMGLNVLGENNEAYSGGLAGWVSNSTVESCTLDANVTIYGMYSGGLFGYVENSRIEDCHFLKGKTVNIYYHINGGLMGKLTGASSLVRNCSFEGNLTAAGYFQGGMVGRMEGGRIEKCVLGSYAIIGCDKYNAGGMVGAALPVEEIVLEHCAVYGTVKGQYAVGGIVGYVGNSGLSDAVQPVTIRGCAVCGAELTATGSNGGSNMYSLIGGIVGWSHGSNQLIITDCCSNPAFIQTIADGNRGAISGMVAFQNNKDTKVVFRNSYSTVTASNMFSQNESVASISGYNFYGAVYCRATSATTIQYCWGDEGIKFGTDDATVTQLGGGSIPTALFSNGTLLASLQEHNDGVQWVAGADGLPIPQAIPADPHVKPKAQKRVSVIGDSISTFRGWIPSGYATHYPAKDGTLTLVNETWWYRLIYDHMQNAELDMNIAFSGSTVTNTTEANLKARYGDTVPAWWQHDFVTRFIECGGVGRPDVVLIHGGTNDWGHDADPLYPGGPTTKSALPPTAEQLNPIFAVADAAVTREQVNALPDNTFCEAYAKLLCLIRNRYPQCKVVCVIGDYLNEAIEHSILDIAAHYGSKCVDLLQVNGFNDQEFMPKHDYNPVTKAGCHPASKAMDFIANKIYTELGTWLEQ